MFELSTIHTLTTDEEPEVKLDLSVDRTPVMFSGMALNVKMELEEILAEGEMLFATLEAIEKFKGLSLEGIDGESFSMVTYAIENASGGEYTAANWEELVALEGGVYDGIGGFFKKLYDKVGAFFGNVHDGSRLALEKLPALRARVAKAPKDFKYAKALIKFDSDMRPLVGVGEKGMVAWDGKSLASTAQVAGKYDPVKFIGKLKAEVAKLDGKTAPDGKILMSVVNGPLDIYPYYVTRDGKHGWDRFFSLVGTFYSGLWVRYDRTFPGFPLHTGTYYPGGSSSFDGVIESVQQIGTIVDVAEKLFKSLENVDGIRKEMDAYDAEITALIKKGGEAAHARYIGNFVLQFCVNQHDYLFDYAKALVALADKALTAAKV